MKIGALVALFSASAGFYLFNKLLTPVKRFAGRFKQKHIRKLQAKDRKSLSTQKRILGHAVLQKKAYDDCKLLAPDGNLIAKINVKRFNWYLRKGLATQIDESTIQLNFEPKGMGNLGDAYYLSEHINRCVVCGDDSHYTKHHVVPHEFRRFFPLDMKSASSHDIVLLCSNCHELYETDAMDVKKQLAIKYSIPFTGEGKVLNSEVVKMKKLAKALKNFSEKMPEEKRQEALNEFAKKLNKKPEDVTEADFKEVLKLDNIIIRDEKEGGYKAFGKLLVERVVGAPCETPEFERDAPKLLDEFSIMWRKHFVETMKPKFLNEHWDVERSLIRVESPTSSASSSPSSSSATPLPATPSSTTSTPISEPQQA